MIASAVITNVAKMLEYDLTTDARVQCRFKNRTVDQKKPAWLRTLHKRASNPARCKLPSCAPGSRRPMVIHSVSIPVFDALLLKPSRTYYFSVLDRCQASLCSHMYLHDELITSRKAAWLNFDWSSGLRTATTSPSPSSCAALPAALRRSTRTQTISHQA